MKIYKGFLCFTLLLGLAHCLTACGGEEGVPAISEQPTVSPAEKTISTPPPSPAEKPGNTESDAPFPIEPYMSEEEADRWEEAIQELPDYPSNFDDNPEGAEDYEAAKIWDDMASETEDD